MAAGGATSAAWAAAIANAFAAGGDTATAVANATVRLPHTASDLHADAEPNDA